MKKMSFCRISLGFKEIRTTVLVYSGFLVKLRDPFRRKLKKTTTNKQDSWRYDSNNAQSIYKTGFMFMLVYSLLQAT